MPTVSLDRCTKQVNNVFCSDAIVCINQSSKSFQTQISLEMHYWVLTNKQKQMEWKTPPFILRILNSNIISFAYWSMSLKKRPFIKEDIIYFCAYLYYEWELRAQKKREMSRLFVHKCDWHPTSGTIIYSWCLSKCDFSDDIDQIISWQKCWCYKEWLSNLIESGFYFWKLCNVDDQTLK